VKQTIAGWRPTIGGRLRRLVCGHAFAGSGDKRAIGSWRRGGVEQCIPDQGPCGVDARRRKNVELLVWERGIFARALISVYPSPATIGSTIM